MKRLKRKHVEQGEGVLRLFSEAYPISHGRLILNDKLNGNFINYKNVHSLCPDKNKKL